LTTTSNWNAVCLAGVTGTALPLVESRADRALFVAAAEAYSQNFLRGFTPDGYCTEGLGYWNYGFGHYLLLAETIHQTTAGRLDLLARPEVRAPATFPCRIEILEGAYPAFADCSVTAKPDARAMHMISRRFGLGLRRWDEVDTAAPHGALFEVMVCSFPNSVSALPPAAASTARPDIRSWFDQAGILVCRPAAESACRLAVALKGGHNAEHHNHNDLGAYVVVVGNKPVLVDPGTEVYTARTFSNRRYESKVLNSYGHPVPVIGGKLQRPGAEARAKVLRSEFSEMTDVLALELSSAYDVPELRRLVRTFVYSRTGAGSLTVTDDCDCAAPQAIGTALITFADCKTLGPGVLKIGDDKAAVRVEIEAAGLEFEVQTEELREDTRTPRLPTRIGMDLKQPVRTAAVTVRITPM
jgi:hypothetical protein